MESETETVDSTSALALYPASPESHQALLRGRLVREGGCVYLEGEDGERYLAALPSPGTRWLPDGAGVEIEGRAVPLGARVEVAGGETRVGGDSVDWVQAPAASCDDDLMWIVSGVTRLLE